MDNCFRNKTPLLLRIPVTLLRVLQYVSTDGAHPAVSVGEAGPVQPAPLPSAIF